jgi:hypothetical protein
VKRFYVWVWESAADHDADKHGGAAYLRHRLQVRESAADYDADKPGKIVVVRAHDESDAEGRAMNEHKWDVTECAGEVPSDVPTSLLRNKGITLVNFRARRRPPRRLDFMPPLPEDE